MELALAHALMVILLNRVIVWHVIQVVQFVGLKNVRIALRDTFCMREIALISAQVGIIQLLLCVRNVYFHVRNAFLQQFAPHVLIASSFIKESVYLTVHNYQHILITKLLLAILVLLIVCPAIQMDASHALILLKCICLNV